VVENSPLEDLFEHPCHPYSEGLLCSIPDISSERKRLYSIEGTVPNPFEKRTGCSFAPRCEYATERCHQQIPELETLENGRQVRCWNWQETGKLTGSR